MKLLKLLLATGAFAILLLLATPLAALLLIYRFLTYPFRLLGRYLRRRHALRMAHARSKSPQAPNPFPSRPSYWP